MIYDVPTRWMSAYDMYERATYLRKAIETYCRDNNDVIKYKLSSQEWSKLEFLVEILAPFKSCNARMESTSRPGIEKVFWIYETLFNELDRLSDILEQSKSTDKAWINELYPALIAMRAKLSKYYAKTGKSTVYADAVILDPKQKLALFQQQSWSDIDVNEYTNKCRSRYTSQYQNLDQRINLASTPTNKRSYAVMEEEDDDFSRMLDALPSDDLENEFDQYLASPRSKEKLPVLDLWRSLSEQYPHLALMVRDIFAVPGTGAGVERQFSRSGKVETKLRARIHPKTTCEIMMYKDYLSRCNKSIKVSEMTNFSVIEVEDTSDENVPEEWRSGWFKIRKRLRRIV